MPETAKHYVFQCTKYGRVKSLSLSVIAGYANDINLI